MTQEEKELLLVDLCARLPYLVRCTYPNDIGLHIPITEINIHDNGLVGIHGKVYNLYDIKPYLRPMLSMTEEEKEDIKPLFLQVWTDDNKRLLVVRQNKMAEYLNYLYSHHLDFRGLIPMGLALEAPEDMYK